MVIIIFLTLQVEVMHDHGGPGTGGESNLTPQLLYSLQHLATDNKQQHGRLWTVDFWFVMLCGLLLLCGTSNQCSCYWQWPIRLGLVPRIHRPLGATAWLVCIVTIVCYTCTGCRRYRLAGQTATDTMNSLLLRCFINAIASVNNLQ